MFTKSIVRSLCALSVGVLALAVAVPGSAWDEITIDNETHRNKTSLVQGTYTDWTNLPRPWNESQWPYVMNNFSRYTSSWDGTQARHGVAVWRVQIPKTGWYDLKGTYKRTENRTRSAQYYIYNNVTIEDIETYKAKDPILHKVFDQWGHNDEAGEWHYVKFGAVCLKEGDVSVIVLDARDTDRSSSADAMIWTYIGETYNNEACRASTGPSAATNYLLLK